MQKFLIMYETVGASVPSEQYPMLNSGYDDIRKGFDVLTEEEADRCFDPESIRFLQILKNVKAIVLDMHTVGAGSRINFVLVVNGERVLYGHEDVTHQYIDNRLVASAFCYYLYEGEDSANNPRRFEGRIPFPKIYT